MATFIHLNQAQNVIGVMKAVQFSAIQPIDRELISFENRFYDKSSANRSPQQIRNGFVRMCRDYTYSLYRCSYVCVCVFMW